MGGKVYLYNEVGFAYERVLTRKQCCGVDALADAPGLQTPPTCRRPRLEDAPGVLEKKSESASTYAVYVKRLSTGIVGTLLILRNVSLHELSIFGKDSFTVLKRISYRIVFRIRVRASADGTLKACMDRHRAEHFCSDCTT